MRGPIPFCPVCSRQIMPGQSVLRVEPFADENDNTNGFDQVLFFHADHLMGLLIGARA